MLLTNIIKPLFQAILPILYSASPPSSFKQIIRLCTSMGSLFFFIKQLLGMLFEDPEKRFRAECSLEVPEASFIPEVYHPLTLKSIGSLNISTFYLFFNRIHRFIDNFSKFCRLHDRCRQ